MYPKNLVLSSILSTFFLLLIGAVVHNSQSGLSCSGWSFCTENIKNLEVYLSILHRLVATLTGVLIILMTYSFYKEKSKYKNLFKFSTYALALVLFQGGLGGVTVMYGLPTIVSTFHLIFSIIFFLFLIYIFHECNKIDQGDSYYFNKIRDNSSMRLLWPSYAKFFLVVLGVGFFTQIILGGFVRHFGAGASCGLGFENSFICKELETIGAFVSSNDPKAQFHFIHRYFGVFIFALSFLVSGLAYLKFSKIQSKLNLKLKFMPLFTLIPFFSLTQVALGFSIISAGISFIPTTLHLAVAVITISLIWKLYLDYSDLEQVVFLNGHNTFFNDLFAITKPKLSALVMVTAFAGMVFAPIENISLFKGLASLILTYLVVMGAGALNCYMERELDKKMERTKDRPIPAGRMNPLTALFFGILLHLIAIPLLVFWVNSLTAILAVAASVLYLFAYTPMKKLSAWAVVVGAVPGAIPPLMGVTTFTGTIEANGISIFLILLIWQLPHFLAISIFHKDDYGSAGFKIFPLSRGILPTRNSIFLYTVMLLFTAALPYSIGGASFAYFIASLLLGLVFLAMSVEGFFVGNDELVLKSWARRYFWGSIIYLPLLFAALMFLR